VTSFMCAGHKLESSHASRRLHGKRVVKKLDWLHAAQVEDVYSVSSCISPDFADYIRYWKHNGYWFFDSPELIRELGREKSVSLERTLLFYYEAYEREFDREKWSEYVADATFPTHVVPPSHKQLEGF